MIRRCPYAAILLLALTLNATALTGTVKSTSGDPVPYTFVGLLSADYALVSHGITGADGAFSLDGETKGARLVVQPPADENPQGYGVYKHQPRIYALDGATQVGIRLPEVACLVVRAYDAEGKLMRWEDFEARGLFGGAFMYASNLNDEMMPAAPWPVHDAASREVGSPREKGLPALTVAPGTAYAVQVLFWETAGHGKLQLRADNAGRGYRPASAGQIVVVDLNVELARTALADLERRLRQWGVADSPDAAQVRQEFEAALSISEPASRAAACDKVLARALRLRDTLEVEQAKARIPQVRKGTYEVAVVDAAGNPVPDCTVRVAQQESDFRFGVFQGGTYHKEPYVIAREAGFNMFTILPAWGWTDAREITDWSAVARGYGLPQLRAMGYQTAKAHGVVWLQDYGVLPERVRNAPQQQLAQGAIEQLKGLLKGWGESIDVWEVMNEPATTNVIGMPRHEVIALLGNAARTIERYDPDLVTLVNSPHESNYGSKYLLFGTDNRPVNDYPQTYWTFLKQVQDAGALKDVDVIGLQYYPGSHLNEEVFGGLQAPATTLGWMADLFQRYASFGKELHITEFSMPSRYGDGWKSGYWREKWTPELQADYAEAAFTLAFGTPEVGSITWWDIMDKDASVIGGGLVDTSGNPKPVLLRLTALMKAWVTDATVSTDPSGTARMPAFAGTHHVRVETKDGRMAEKGIRVKAGETATVTLQLDGTP